ncbi:MAG TPA: Scr1 family TA system antitoxin-like transcriptional regulator [Streptosporangiaceae bacterium]
MSSPAGDTASQANSVRTARAVAAAGWPCPRRCAHASRRRPASAARTDRSPYRGGPAAEDHASGPPPIGAGAHPGLAGQFAIASFAGSPDVVYLDNALAGQIAERAEAVSRVTLLYDILKAEALAPRASIDLVRKAVETWT